MGSHHPAVAEQQVALFGNISNTTTVKTETKHTCTAIIWLKNGSDTTAKRAIVSTLKMLKGVSDVHCVREKPCIMMVDYCREEVRATTVIGAINIHGGLARIVGC